MKEEHKKRALMAVILIVIFAIGFFCLPWNV